MSTNSMRDVLFGDLPVWPPDSVTTDQPPFSHFIRARTLLQSGDTNGATAAWKSVLQMPGLESRQYLQAWHFLRQHAHQPPPSIAKSILGIVVEVGMPGGLDLLAAYADHTARYFNNSGAGVVWDHPDTTLDAQIEGVLAIAATVAQRIGPWQGPRPGPISTDHTRINLLTPSGLHFGEGPIDVIARDALGGKLFNAAAGLMQLLINKTPRHA